MIHVLTVHWRRTDWIAPQRDFLARNLTQPYRTYAWLNHIEGDYRDCFDQVFDQPLGSHARKLNRLADYACRQAQSDADVLLFLDGDAFPIRPLAAMLEELQHHPLIAVQRLENLGDPQPHPCFCLTTVGFWQEIDGDWEQGYRWRNTRGEWVTDVGARLLEKLTAREIAWKPLLRSNRTNLHPLWFAIYGDSVYHHGAGFRPPISRLDLDEDRGWLDRLLNATQRRLPQKGTGAWLHRMLDEIERKGPGIAARNSALAERILRELQNDPEFYRQFTD